MKQLYRNRGVEDDEDDDDGKSLALDDKFQEIEGLLAQAQKITAKYDKGQSAKDDD